jgi:hypothetical protein
MTMRIQSRTSRAVVVSTISCLFLFPSFAQSEDSISQVQAALAPLDTWLKVSPSGEGWRTYLKLPALESEVAKGNDADPAVIGETLKQLDSGAPGLELPQFKQLRDAVGQWSEDLVIAKAPSLTEAVLASEANFHPITEADVAQAKTELQAALKKLDQYLGGLGKNGAAWKEYLRWKDLQEQLQRETPEADTSKAVLQQYTADQNGLELPVFYEVGAALERYSNLLAASKEDLKSQFTERLKGLADKLKQYQDPQAQTEELAAAVGTDLGWLETRDQARPLVHAIRSRLSQPNLHIEASERLIAAGIDQPLDEVGPVTDNILGTSISGMSHTVGQVTAQLVPDDKRAQVETKLVARAASNTVGYNGPATIHSSGMTDLAGAKRIVIDEKGFASYPAKATASTKTQITGINAGGNMAQRVATSRVYENKPQAEQIAASHAAARAQRRLDAQTGQMLSKAHANYLQKFRNPLLRRREFPTLLKFHSSDDSLFVTALQANRDQIGAPQVPAAPSDEHDLAVRMHETVVNNAADALLSGTTLKEKEMQDKVIEWRGELPEQLKSEEDRDPWSITFAKSRPVSIKFADNHVKITVRGQRYTSGEREFKGMNVTADYRIVPSGSSYKLVRDAELHIEPPNFVPGQTRLSTQQVTLKTLLQRKFGKLFEPEIKAETLKLSGKWEKAGPLDLKALQSNGGWLVAAWLESAPPPSDTPSARAGGNVVR